MSIKKPTWLDGILGSQLRDTQGEMLSVEGADISELEAGRGLWNDNHSKGAFNTLGRITYAKKIFKAEDCEDDRQRYYWEKIRTPYIYGKGYLFDDEDHHNAKAAAAILRNIHKTDSPLKLKFSVEGGVIARGISDPTLLARTKITKCALTFVPANNATLAEPLNLDKSLYDEAADLILIKSVMHLAETNVPSFRHIVRDASASRVVGNIEKIVELMKGDDSIDIPTKHEILQYALEAKIQANVATIHELVNDLRQNEEIQKGIKGALAGAALMAGTAMMPSESVNLNEPPQPNTVQQADPAATSSNFVSSIRSKNPQLHAIAMQESSGGTNLDHPVIKDPKSMHYGMAAGGAWAMMPHTAAYVLKKNPKFKERFPELADKLADVDANHKNITNFFKQNPTAAFSFAKALYDGLKKHHKGDLNKVFHSWNQGVDNTKDALDRGEDLSKHDYVEKVNNWLKTSMKKPNLNKALMAGYGGASVPTSRTGGGVMQAESLDTGNGKGFKYITCDGCGKEQIYSKFQVKCRDCGKSWSLDKLHKVMCGISRS